ncbi:MAG: M48 family metalloprotease [Planctomycetes bacterium]|nr:M48 family metalloprotease [Planctomycetota bacterium]
MTHVCPVCRTTGPVDAGSSAWCAACGWNVERRRTPGPETRYEKLLDRVVTAASRRYGPALHTEMIERGEAPAGWSASYGIAWLLAALVNAGVLAMPLVALALLAYAPVMLLAAIPASILVLLAWGMFPRPWPMPNRVVERAQVPELYRLIDEVAAAVRAPAIHALALSGDFNACLMHVGWRRRTVLQLGLPLLAVLDPQERVALLGHELGHAVADDPLRSGMIDRALVALSSSAQDLRPDALVSAEIGLLAIPFNVLLLGLSLMVEGLALFVLFVAAREHQRGEYRADLVAARVAGTAGALGAMARLQSVDAVLLAIQRYALRGDSGDLDAELRAAVADLPPRERERIARAERSAGIRLDASHPPTAYRIELLHASPVTTPAVTLTAPANARIEAELAALPREIRRAAVDAFRSGRPA